MHVHPLQISCTYQGQEVVLYPVLLTSDDEMILVDCGYEGSLPLLEEAIASHGRSIDDLTGIIITHHDIDHMGGAFELLVRYPHVKVYASEGEAPYISGAEKSLRLVQAESAYDSLPDAYKVWAMNFQISLRNVRPVKVDAHLPYRMDEAFLPGVYIVPTPGHTPGHISLYLIEDKVLIAADAIVWKNDAFDIANPQYALDLKDAICSVEALHQLCAEKVICYHGGICDHEVQVKLQELLHRYHLVQ